MYTSSNVDRVRSISTLEEKSQFDTFLLCMNIGKLHLLSYWFESLIMLCIKFSCMMEVKWYTENCEEFLSAPSFSICSLLSVEDNDTGDHWTGLYPGCHSLARHFPL